MKQVVRCYDYRRVGHPFVDCFGLSWRDPSAKVRGGALGIGGSSNAFMSGRAAGNALTRLTALLAVAFFSTSMILAVLTSQGREQSSILDSPGLGGDVQPSSPGSDVPESPQAPVAQ